ncbi:hypothetical protein ABEF93_000062 [Exophiala dermatitidis]
MLERASSCVEPVSQVLLRRFEPPIRSRRILGPSFWKNGTDELAVAPWWPLYLDNIRGKEICRPGTVQGRQCVKSRRAIVRPSSGRTRPLSLTPGPPPYSCPPESLSRAYTNHPSYEKRNPGSRQLNTNALAVRPSYDTEGPKSPDVRGQDISSTSDGGLLDEDAGKTVARRESYSLEAIDSRAETASPTNRDLRPLDIRSSRPLEDTEEMLQQILDGREAPVPDSKETNVFETVWALFKRLPNQEAYAARVFYFMSKSTSHQDLKLALRAFKIIPHEKRTVAHYERAARTAIQRNDYRSAISINAEATARHLNQECSTFLLLHTASNQLWKAAAQVWSTSFESLTRNRQRLSVSAIGKMLLEQVDRYQNLPLAVSNLAREIIDRRAVVMHQAGLLMHLGRELLHVLVQSGRQMSLVDPEMLVSTFEHYRQLKLLNPTVHLHAVNTLLKSVNRLDRGKSVGLIYHHLRSKYPDFQPPPSLYGSILSILAQEGAPSEVHLYYLRQFAHLHGAADKISYQKVLTALAAQGDVDGTQAVFIELCKVHSRPTDIAYFTPLLYAYARLGDIEGTEREFQRLKDWGLQPTLYCWNILLYAYARSAHPGKAFDIFETMKAQGLRPDVYTFGTLMGIVSKAGDIEAVVDIIEQAQQFHIKGSYEMISGLVHSYCLNDQADVAERLAEVTTKASFEGEPVKMWNYLLRHYAFQSDSEGVVRVQERMNALGVKPDDMSYAALMAALVVIGKTSDAAQILKSLNTSRTLAATAFHYSIVLQGYVQEGNRKMADEVYKEMLETFPRLTPSARLAMLHLQGLQSLNAEKSFLDANDYLGTLLHELASEDQATKHPQPGFGRRSPVHALPSIYVEFMASILASTGKTGQADKLLQKVDSLSQSSYLGRDRGSEDSIDLLTTRLIISTHRHDWETVERTWKQILDRALDAASPHSIKQKVTPPKNQIEQPSPTTQDTAIGLDLIGGSDFAFTSMIPTSSSSGSSSVSPSLDRPGLKVLFSQRFILEAPITRYLRALELQKHYQHATDLVEKLQKVGFALTSRNWNFYIQMLTRSPDPNHWILAFKTFEEKFLPNTPPWRHLRAGKWSTPSSAKTSTTDAVVIARRRTLEKLDRGHLMPTYVTAVHLAANLLESNRRAAHGDVSINVDLWRSSPGTYRYIRRIPRSKDRIQGGVLRGRNILGDLQKPLRRATHKGNPKGPDTTITASEPNEHKIAHAEEKYEWLPRDVMKAKAKSKKRVELPPTSGALYDTLDRRLEKRAEAQRKGREERRAMLDDATRHQTGGKFSIRKLAAVLPRDMKHCSETSRNDLDRQEGLPESSESQGRQPAKKSAPVTEGDEKSV